MPAAYGSLIPALVLAVGQADRPGSWNGYGHPHMWNWMGWWHPLLWLLFVLAIIFVIASLVRGVRRGSRGDGIRRDPLDIARERYAKGEISREEFERIRRDLRE